MVIVIATLFLLPFIGVIRDMLKTGMPGIMLLGFIATVISSFYFGESVGKEELKDRYYQQGYSDGKADGLNCVEQSYQNGIKAGKIQK